MRQDDRKSRCGSMRNDVRGNALWGNGKKLTLALATMLVALVALTAGQVKSADAAKQLAYMSPGLLDQAAASPNNMFDVIVQAAKERKSADVVKEVEDAQANDPAPGSKLKRQFVSIAGTSASLSGKQILKLARRSWVESITSDPKVALTSYSSGSQIWQDASGVSSNWNALPSGTT